MRVGLYCGKAGRAKKSLNYGAPIKRSTTRLPIGMHGDVRSCTHPAYAGMGDQTREIHSTQYRTLAFMSLLNYARETSPAADTALITLNLCSLPPYFPNGWCASLAIYLYSYSSSPTSQSTLTVA
jgi:hypothetical protein